jgi:hypothetical protein
LTGNQGAPTGAHAREGEHDRRSAGAKTNAVRDCLNCGQDAGRKNGKYCSNACQQAYQRKQTKERIVRDGVVSTGVAPVRTAKRYVAERDGKRCSVCGGTEWRGQPIPLVLDHIDGNAANWQLTNLRLVCPNCDAQLPTFKSRNRGKGRAARRQRYAAGESY